MKKNLMDYVIKKYHDKVQAIEQLPDYWDDEKQQFRHQYKITCKDGWGFDTGGGFNQCGYPETVKEIIKWFKEFLVEVKESAIKFSNQGIEIHADTQEWID